jgi:hypothetical protein
MSLLGFGMGEAVGGVGYAVGGVARGAGTVLSKLGDILLSPINTMCNWIEEPLKRGEYKRQEGLKRVEHELSEEAKNNDVQRKIDSKTGVAKALSEQKMLEMEFSTDMKIKRETEIIRIITEIEELKKDKEFERMKKVSDAMMDYQKELTRINVEAVEAIGSMRIDLQRKAYELIHEKTQQYSELQNRAIQQAAEQLTQIDNNPNMRESSKDILSKAVDEKLAGIIRNATRFIEQLNDDMQLISKDINLITSSGQKFIERHLEQFQLIGFSEQTTALLSHDDSSRE